ncbi:MAG: SET domain-containing protein-lysine N-methyltransferase [Caldilineaceae bacterium]
MHIYVDEPGILFSHSCEPNLGLRDNAEAFDFVAAADIAAGTELTFHYGMSEIYSVAVDACACGSSRCAGRSVGFAEMTPDERKRLMALGVSQYAMQIHSALQIA